MARSLRISYPNAFYHITSRGNEQKAIFKSNRDREKFLEYLESATRRYDAIIHAYCLMDNHYHFLLETPSGNLSQIMAHINGAYTNYFNAKRKRYGHLFQGRYKAILVEADEYSMELSRYIHLNPVRAKVVEQPEEYEWSSYSYYIGKKKAPEWLKMDFILGYFGREIPNSQKAYRKFVAILINEEYKSPLEDVVRSTLLGTQEFIEIIKDKYLTGRKEDKNIPALKAFKKRITIEEISKKVDEIIRDDGKLRRNITIYLAQRHTGKRLDEIGEHFSIGGSGVCQAGRRIAVKMETNKALAKNIKKIEDYLSKMKT
ncbi:MAG: transposase [Deltaproteobacteria bacterium]|nr:transposase [Deltaproteobacteria bacterium]